MFFTILGVLVAIIVIGAVIVGMFLLWNITLKVDRIEDYLSIEEYTCYECEARGSCDLAWDEYNRDGDCLADK